MEKEIAIIVDVDGTLADMKGVRGPFEWNKVHLDKPHWDVVELIRDLASVGYEDYDSKSDACYECGAPEDPSFVRKYKIIIVTGRDGSCTEETCQWLHTYEIPWDDFYIRNKGDFRKDSIVKAEIYMDHIRPKYDVKYVIDDRDQVVDMWRSLGLRVLQVAPGNF